ncbi:MAG: TIM barrel protein [Eubacteriales bacterium]|nr:TIM barrel protein [Eubacteriales bacterium]
MENKLRFGPSGNSKIFYDSGYKHSVDAPKFCKVLGLSAYEYSFGRGFTMSYDTAKVLGDNAKLNDILLSIHAPYYINLANENDDMATKSYEYVRKGMEYIKVTGGRDLVVHLASCGKLDRSRALYLTDKRLDECLKIIYDSKLNSVGKICPETMGKYLQIGTYNEVIDFCTKDEILVPTFDFGHINCVMQGGLKTIDDYKKIFDYCFSKLGEEKTKNCHIHFSKIEYGDKGEIKHLNLDDNIFGPEFEPLARVIDEYKLTPTVISESKEKMMEDAIKLKEIYDSCKQN